MLDVFSGAGALAEPVVTPDGTFPVYEGDEVTLKIFVNCNDSQQITDWSYEGNAFTKYISDLTGVKIEWIEERTNGIEKLNLLLASNDKPDIIFSNMSPEMALTYGSQGIFLDVEPLLEEYGYYFNKNLVPYMNNVMDRYRMADGHVYNVPKVMGAYEVTYEQMCMINKAWLDKLGLEMPTTIEELEQVLIAFKTQDPNGNGIADEIPLIGYEDASSPGNVWAFLMFPFIYHGGEYSTLINRDGNEIYPAFTQDEWKEGLKWMRSLYDQGLIDPESFTADRAAIRQIMTQDEALVGVVVTKGPHHVMDSSIDGFYDYVYLPPLKGPDGVARHMYTPDIAKIGDVYYYVAITSDCKYPEIAIRFLDAFYDVEVSHRSMYGELDVDWRYGVEGEYGVNGEPAVWAALNQVFAVENAKVWQMSGPTFWPIEWRYGEKLDRESGIYSGAYTMYTAAKEIYAPYAEEEKNFYNDLLIGLDDLEDAVIYQNGIYSYLEQSFAQFITGERDIDAEWDRYLSDLDAYGLDEWMQLQIKACEVQHNEKVTYRK